MYGKVVQGVFLKESKYRFISLVNVDNEIVECYVPNSSRMGKYVRLKNKKVLLTINKNVNGRTKYTLFAVKYYNSYILLNLNQVNRILEIAISHNWLYPLTYYNIYKEQKIDDYRADIMLKNENEKIIVEAKGIISTNKVVLFPKVYSDRFITQLTKLKEFLLEGLKVHYYFVSLSKYVQQIVIDINRRDYYNLISECISLGMEIKAFSINYKDGSIYFNKLLSVNCGDIEVTKEKC